MVLLFMILCLRFNNNFQWEAFRNRFLQRKFFQNSSSVEHKIWWSSNQMLDLFKLNELIGMNMLEGRITQFDHILPLSVCAIQTLGPQTLSVDCREEWEFNQEICTILIQYGTWDTWIKENDTFGTRYDYIEQLKEQTYKPITNKIRDSPVTSGNRLIKPNIYLCRTHAYNFFSEILILLFQEDWNVLTRHKSYTMADVYN